MSETCGLDCLQRVQGRLSETRDYVASTGTGKSGNLCKRYMRICSGIDTEMSSCIFSGSKVQRGRFGTLGKPCFRAVRCREAVGVQD